MKKLTNKSGEVRELQAEDFATAKALPELPASLQKKLKALKRGRPPVENPKRTITFKLSPDVIDGIRAGGKGYNARVDALLRNALEHGQL